MLDAHGVPFVSSCHKAIWYHWLVCNVISTNVRGNVAILMTSKNKGGSGSVHLAALFLQLGRGWAPRHMLLTKRRIQDDDWLHTQQVSQ